MCSYTLRYHSVRGPSGRDLFRNLCLSEHILHHLLLSKVQWSKISRHLYKTSGVFLWLTQKVFHCSNSVLCIWFYVHLFILKFYLHVFVSFLYLCSCIDVRLTHVINITSHHLWHPRWRYTVIGLCFFVTQNLYSTDFHRIRWKGSTLVTEKKRLDFWW